MKKEISVMSIAVRSSSYKILLILLGMATVQLGLFYDTYLKYDYSEERLVASESSTVWGKGYGVTWTLESLVEESHVHMVFLAAFAMICLVLAWAQSERKGVHTYYFYERLQVGTKSRFVGWSLYNFACMILLLFAELLVVLGMGSIFIYMVPEEYESAQMFFMAFYKSRFLHNIFPMAEIYRWFRNVLLFGACSMEIAAFACMKRKPWEMFMLILLILFGFVQDIGTFGGMDIVLILVSLICIGVTGYKVFIDGGAEE